MKDDFIVENSKSQKYDFSWVFTERVTNNPMCNSIMQVIQLYLCQQSEEEF